MPERDPSQFKIHESDLTAYKEELRLWNAVMRGGVIVCETSGKAVNLRYRMYRIRKKLQGSNGQTPYDDLIIKCKFGDNRLVVEFRSAGVVEVIPADVTDQDLVEIEDRRQNVVVSRRKPLIQEE